MAGSWILPRNNISIRTIYIYPVEKWLRPAIDRHFKEYGAVESIDFRSKNEFGFAFVQFENAASASASMVKHIHNISGLEVKVKAAHYWHQPDAAGNKHENNNILLIPPDFDSPSNILHCLNDDCLLEIFERLPLRDLCSVADVCTSFKYNAETVFSTYFTDFNVNLLFGTKNPDYCFNLKGDRFLLERAFRNFGAYMKKLCLGSYFSDDGGINRILELVAVHCSNQNSALEELTLFDLRINQELVPRLIPVFEHLKRLTIVSGSYNHKHGPLLSTCEHLVHLTLHDINWGKNYDYKFEKLEFVGFSEIRNLNEDRLNRFLKNHPKLKSLTLCDQNGISSNIYRTIGSLAELEELQVIMNISVKPQNVKPTLNHLAQLEHLRRLTFNCRSLPAGELLETMARSMIPIDDLCLTNFTLDSKVVNNLVKFTQMKKLDFSDGKIEDISLAATLKMFPELKELVLTNFGQISVQDIKEIVKNVKKLEVLKLLGQDDAVIDVNNFNAIVKLIGSRCIKLKILISGHRCKLDVPANVINENLKLLDIQIEHFSDFEYFTSDDDDDDDEYMDFSDYFNYDSDDSDDKFFRYLNYGIHF